MAETSDFSTLYMQQSVLSSFHVTVRPVTLIHNETVMSHACAGVTLIGVTFCSMCASCFSNSLTPMSMFQCWLNTINPYDVDSARLFVYAMGHSRFRTMVLV